MWVGGECLCKAVVFYLIFLCSIFYVLFVLVSFSWFIFCFVIFVSASILDATSHVQERQNVQGNYLQMLACLNFVKLFYHYFYYLQLYGKCVTYVLFFSPDPSCRHTTSNWGREEGGDGQGISGQLCMPSCFGSIL